MPIGTNLGNLIRAATGSLLGIGQGQEEQASSLDPFDAARQSTQVSPDQVLLSIKNPMQDLLVGQESLPAVPQQPQQAQTQTPAALQEGLIAKAPEQGQGLVGLDQLQTAEQIAAQPAVLNPGETTNPAAPQNGKFQQLLQSWLQLDPRTISGLQNFLAVEFSHHPEDAQIFMNVQMMRMLKQARTLIEEQKLQSASFDEQTAQDSPEALQRAMLGASLTGYAYYKVLRRRVKLRDSVAAGLGIQQKEGEEPLTLFAILQQAALHLKEAERELQRAMSMGAQRERVLLLIQRILEIYSDIKEVQVEASLNNEAPNSEAQIPA